MGYYLVNHYGTITKIDMTGVLCEICDKPVGANAFPLALTDHRTWACYKCFKNPVRRERFYKKRGVFRRKLQHLKDLLYK